MLLPRKTVHVGAAREAAPMGTCYDLYQVTAAQ